jgi:hypothetical protein
METTIGTLLGKLKGPVSKGFLLTGFIPALFFLSSNIGLTYVVFPSTRTRIDYFFRLSFANQAFHWLAAILIVFVVGIALWSLNSWFRQFLEGRFLPASIRNYLERNQAQELRACETKLKKARDIRAGYRQAAACLEEEKATLLLARNQGNTQAPGKIGDGLNNLYERLKHLQAGWHPIPIENMGYLFKALRTELARIPADVADGKKLDEIHTDYPRLVAYGLSKVECAYNKAWTERKIRFPEKIEHLGPTRMANLSEVHREYGISYYGLDIDWFWLRLLKVIKADPEFAPIMEEAKIQLDFTVAGTVLIALITGIWLILAGYFAPVIYFVVLCTGGPLSVIFYNISLQNYRTFIEAVRSAVDLHRFDLLNLLHVKAPIDSTEEKATWEKLMKWGFDNSDPIVYQHSKAPSPEKAAQKSPSANVVFWINGK